ncbi:MAG: adenylate/guanylate cyclase domain-containing protein [Bacteroidota bacterium]|nr:adenylate/guanylate cyclase domain-containing protein [Bacteroidota bacterium]
MLNRYSFIKLIILLSFIPYYSHAQSVQNLERKLLTASNREKTAIFIKLGYKHVNDNPQTSLEFGKDALENAKSVNDQKGRAMAFGLIGQSFYKLKNYKQAEDNFDEEGELIEQSGKPWMINRFNLGLSSHNRGKERKAINSFEASLEEAKKLKNEEYILKNYEALFNVHVDKNRYKTALKYFELYINERDEKFLEQNRHEINQMQNAYKAEIGELEVEKEAIQDTLGIARDKLTMLQLEQKVKDLELKHEKLKQTRMMWVILLLAIIAMIILIFYFQKQRSNKIITAEKAKSDELLHNILPAKVVKELKENGKSNPENFQEVTVFFSDFVGFTKLSSAIKPETLIAELNELFTRFDEIMEKHECERIKTIGDAYLAVCGLPEKNPGHVNNILHASLEISEWLAQRNKNNSLNWQIRIGVHSGNLIGGIVGIKKYIYDVFGDTINTASRMESNSEAGCINVSEQTRKQAQNHFTFIERPKIEVKGKGKMKMYFLKGAKK